jgi:DNA polymerase-3 subunit gamma/tau
MNISSESNLEIGMTDNNIKIKEVENFVVTARKWRPLLFADVVGQEHITSTLRNALISHRLNHSFLFCGPRGVGKTTTARILGRAVNCTNLSESGEPCNECENCLSVINGRSLDIIEIDGASNTGVDDVRALRENAKYPPSVGAYKMYIIDEVHMLSNNAFNALLKILEEPPAHLLFVFATTESHKVPATIVSRCQRYDFRRMEQTSIVDQLKYSASKEGITIDEKSLNEIAKKSDGSMRDSQSIFDQIVSFCGTDIEFSRMSESLHLIDEEFYFKITDCIANKDILGVFNLSNEVVSKGYELQETLVGLVEHIRNLLTVKVSNGTDLITTSDVIKAKYLESAKQFTNADLLRYVQIINQTEASLRFTAHPRIKFELALVQLASMDKMLDVTELIEKIRNIKEIPITQNNSQTIEIPSDISNEKKKITPEITNESADTISQNDFVAKKTIKKEAIYNEEINKIVVPNQFNENEYSTSNISSSISSSELTDTEKQIMKLFGATRVFD